MTRARDDWAAYMRDYRRRRSLNNHQPLGTRGEATGPKAHVLCDRRIAELEAEVAMLKKMIGEAF